LSLCPDCMQQTLFPETELIEFLCECISATYALNISKEKENSQFCCLVCVRSSTSIRSQNRVQPWPRQGGGKASSISLSVLMSIGKIEA
jgi:hypothetical protein